MKRIVGGKWGPCAGQACIGIDYLLVQQKLAPVLVLCKSFVLFNTIFAGNRSNIQFFVYDNLFQIESLKSCIKRFYGENVENLQSICRIVNKHHFDRICNLLEEPGVAASIVYGGSLDRENLLVPFIFSLYLFFFLKIV